MKKIFIFLIIISPIIFSCNKDDSQDDSLEAFINDPSVQMIASTRAVLAKRNIGVLDQEIIRNINIVASHSKLLIKKYKRERVEGWLVQLIENDRKSEKSDLVSEIALRGDKCNRDADGSINMEECNFWEYLLVMVKSALTCDQPGPEQITFPGLLEDYFTCVQGVVCKTC